jgi:hypothetical protein
MLTETQKKLLEAPLPRDVIRTLTAKGSVDYVDGWYIIGRLNEVFGVDGWAASYGAPTVREGQRPCIYVPASLTVAGVTKHDIGVGVAANDSADSFETAIKGAYTDGLKRCARLLGDSFGLALYEKVKGTQKRSGVGMATTTLAYLEEVDAAPTLDALAHWVDAHLDALKAIPDDEKRAVRDAVKTRRLELQEAAMETPPQIGAPAPQLAAATSPVAAQTAANDRPSTPPAPVEAPANPAASEALSAATRRLAVARTIQTITAIVRAAPVQKIERASLWDATLRAAQRVGSTEAALRESLDRAEAHGATAAQWGLVATVLVALDSCASAAGIEAVRKQYGATVAQLPAPLLAGVKGATSDRARELGAPTVATKLSNLAAEAKTPAELTAIYGRLEGAAKAGQVNQAEVDAVTAALNARSVAIAAAVAA